jgi:hypothetical protein
LWDPEKYFDLMKLAKAAATQIKIKETEIVENGGCGDSNTRKTSNEEEIKKKPIDLTDISTINEYLNLNPGSSSTYEVIFCSLNTENNFYVNLVSLIPTFDELTIKLNEYCNLQQQMYIKG